MNFFLLLERQICVMSGGLVNRNSFAGYKARKRYRKELAQSGIKVLCGRPIKTSEDEVNPVPLSTLLRHNDLQLHQLVSLFREDHEEEQALSEGEIADEAVGKHGKVRASLREQVTGMVEDARTKLAQHHEVQERGAAWGEKQEDEYCFLMTQARNLMELKGITPYIEGGGSIKPAERVGEVE